MWKTSGVIMCWLLLVPGFVQAAEQRMELDSTSVIGSRELPQVVHILSWQQTRPDQSVNTLNPSLHSLLSPIDRKVFLRELRVFDQLQYTPAAPPQ